MAEASSRRTKAGRGLLVIISSPSGGGKSTVIRKLRQKHPEYLYSISTTTRGKRAGERNGTHYNFVTTAQFQRLVKSGRLVEWASVHDQFYGTPKANIARANRLKRVMLFDLDVQGAATMRKNVPSVVTIFIMPPSWEVLKKRLEGRRSETIAQRRRRLRTAREELRRKHEYEYWVVNDHLEQCVEDCAVIIRAESLKSDRRS
ncbi:MAG: guanylate kinase [candidate division Zixibacteria bacterium]|nr:guanylate kinase [candidate division Zixibacteria bacterium]